MRRVLILLLILVIVGGGAVAALLVVGGGGDSDPTEAEQTETAIAADGIGEEGNNGGSSQVERTPVPTEEPYRIYVAARPIPRGKQIEADDLKLQDWSNDLFPIYQEIPESKPFNLEDHGFLDVNDDLVTNIERDVIDQYARTDIPAYTPIFPTHIANVPSDLAAVGSDVATLITQDRVAISVPLDPTGIGQVAYAMQAGDTVDIMMTFAFIDVDIFFQTRIPNTVSTLMVTSDGTLIFTPPTLGTAEARLFELDVLFFLEETGQATTTRQILPGTIGPSEQIQRPRLVTERIINGARVLHVGWFPEDGRIYGVADTPTPFLPTDTPTLVGTPPQQQQQNDETGDTPTPAPTSSPYTPMIITLEVSPQDAVTLAWAIESGIPMQFALRSGLVEAGVALAPTEPVTLSYMIDVYNLPDPDTLRLTYALEPRPEIRRFDLSSLRRFTELSECDPTTDPNSCEGVDPLRQDLLRENLFLGTSTGE